VLYAITHPSATWLEQWKTVKVRIMKFTPCRSPIPLVFVA